MKSAEFIAPTDTLPIPSSYEESRPLSENPQTEGFSAHDCGCGSGVCMCAEGDTAPPTAPASAAIQVSDPNAANPSFSAEPYHCGTPYPAIEESSPL